jgi:hypothetical protein
MQLMVLQERVDILHERDLDHATRLHNSYFVNAEVRPDRDRLKQELTRERTRRIEVNERFLGLVERLRGERNTWREEVELLKNEVRALEARDSESMEGIWAAHSNFDKIEMVPEMARKGLQGEKRKSDENMGVSNKKRT